MSNNNSTSNAFSVDLTLFEYCTVFCVYSTALVLFVRILWALYKHAKHISLKETKNGLSNLLIANMLCWTLMLATALPHIAWMIGNWRPQVRYVDAYLLFWSTMITQCMMPMLPFSVFLLSLDRIFTIQWLIGYQERHKRALLALCLAVLASVGAINFAAYLRIMPLPEQTACTVFACLMTNGNTTFIASKLAGSILIVVSGVFFLRKLRKLRKANVNKVTLSGTTNESSNNKIDANTLVALMICTELTLNFLPQLVVLIIQQALGHSISSLIGPNNLFLNAIEALITALIYRHTLMRRFESALVGSNIQMAASHKIVARSSEEAPKRRSEPNIRSSRATNHRNGLNIRRSEPNIHANQIAATTMTRIEA